MNLLVIMAVTIGLALGMMLTHHLSMSCKTGSNTQTLLRVAYLICALGLLIGGLALLGAAALGGRP